MGMFDGFRLRNRAAAPLGRDRANANTTGSAPAIASEAVDEFGAPEGGFGRLDMVLDAMKAVSAPQSLPQAASARRADYDLSAPGTAPS